VKLENNAVKMDIVAEAKTAEKIADSTVVKPKREVVFNLNSANKARLESLSVMCTHKEGTFDVLQLKLAGRTGNVGKEEKELLKDKTLTEVERVIIGTKYRNKLYYEYLLKNAHKLPENCDIIDEETAYERASKLKPGFLDLPIAEAKERLVVYCVLGLIAYISYRCMYYQVYEVTNEHYCNVLKYDRNLMGYVAGLRWPL